jgi:(S)-2-hydroxyglutarate dehydrogenase
VPTQRACSPTVLTAVAFDDPPPARADFAVVGGGIVGLAVARELAHRHPSKTVAVIEREPRLGEHQTGHSSGVVHAGIYYAPGSLKAKLCTEGARLLYDYCERHDIAHERSGKLIVATSESELPGIEELGRRGRLNGVPDLRRLDAHQIEAVEPHARGVAALHSPHTGIADFRAVAEQIARDVQAAGGTITTNCRVEQLEDANIRHSQGETRAEATVVCAGLESDRLATQAGAEKDPRIVPFRGAYLRLEPQRRHLVNGLIYPVPDPALPFLGVHLTKHTSGEVLIGPTALVAPVRLTSTLAWPGAWRMARRFWRTGLKEIDHAARRGAVVKAAARFVPELKADDVLPAFAGIRAQAVARSGALVDDFVFSQTGRHTLHVRNAPSPGATSSLAIARFVADRLEAGV